MSKKKYQKPAVYVMATVIGLLQGSELGPGATDVRNPDGFNGGGPEAGDAISPDGRHYFSVWD